jgi:hypothetical protein
MSEETHEVPLIEGAVTLLYDAFAEKEEQKRLAMLERAVSDDVSYWTRDGVVTSRSALLTELRELLVETNGNAPYLTSELQSFHRVARATWKLKIRGRNRSQQGEVYFELGRDHRLEKIVVFEDAPHYLPFNGGVKAYVDAWNSDSEQTKLDILHSNWAEDGRWVEVRFDVSGPQAVAAAMKAPISLDPIDGVMDVISSEQSGLQIRFQVEVTKHDGEVIGTFTDFAEINQGGRVKRLAGFRGASSWSRPLEAVEPGWHWSYRAGYMDASGQFAGGSEVMHLVPHKEKLYAANGYWTDSHWVVPPGEPRQSAQVLRLDESDGQWVVDLDTGIESAASLDFMKGNLLKSVTFTKGAQGNALSSPVNLLVMAAGNIKSHACVWVKDDASGKWGHQVVHSGTPEETEGRRNIRWVPRDIELHTDSVTGQQRIFLLLGNPGIISGVFDPTAPNSIRWDQDVEFPKHGMLSVRPLGMVSANGALYFSGGGTLYRRNDGAEPDYSQVLTLAEDLDPEMGGIRGLSAIRNPNGEGESLIFMWAPDGKSNGEIKRLDPDGKGSYVVHDEVAVGALMEQSLGGDTKAEKTLGAYNDFYPAVDPKTGQLVHIIGFQSVIFNNNAVRGQGGYYRGARYAIRTADAQYLVGEINGIYSEGKPSLVAPRTFAHSPFGDNRIFVAGYDANFIPSTNQAWVFSTSLSTLLAPLHE